MISNIWQSLSGWKTVIGVVALTVYAIGVTYSWWPTEPWAHDVIYGWIGIGGLDKVEKFINALKNS